MTDRIALYGDHVASIIKEQRIAVQWTRGRDSSTAWRRRRCIKIQRIKCPWTYAIALHEIGHIIGPHQNALRFCSEVGAWIYARQAALQWSRMMMRICHECLDSYAARYSQIQSAKMPDASHPIWIEASDILNYQP